MCLHIPFHRTVPKDQESASCGPFKLNSPATALQQAKMVSPCRRGHPDSWALCISIHSTGSTDSLVGEQSWPWHPPLLHTPGLPFGQSWPPLISEASSVTSATAALSCSRAADSTSAPQASWPAAPSSGWPHRPSTNEASWFLFLSKWIN